MTDPSLKPGAHSAGREHRDAGLRTNERLGCAPIQSQQSQVAAGGGREIVLTQAQIEYCERIGNERHDRAEAKGRDRKEAYDGSFSQRARHVDGVLGEKCFALALGLENWEATIDEFKNPDVAGYQVRSTRHQNGRLILRPTDRGCEAEEFALVLLNARGGTVLANSITGKAGMVERFWKPTDARGLGAWWVPQSELCNPINLCAPSGLSLDFVEGTARIIGQSCFVADPSASICWHCGGARRCSCAGCIEFSDRLSGGVWRKAPAKCEACLGAGLLCWFPEVAA